MKHDQRSLQGASRPCVLFLVGLLAAVAVPAGGHAESYRIVPADGTRTSFQPCLDGRAEHKLSELLDLGMTVVFGDRVLRLDTLRTRARSGNFFVAGGFVSVLDENVAIGDWEYSPGLRVLMIVAQDTKECPNAECWYDATIHIAMIREGANACYAGWVARVSGGPVTQ